MGVNTYIVKTVTGEYYCGKSNDIERRMKEHRNEKFPHWFSFKNRKEFEILFICDGDYEKKIKRFGIKHFIKFIRKGVDPNDRRN